MNRLFLMSIDEIAGEHELLFRRSFLLLALGVVALCLLRLGSIDPALLIASALIVSLCLIPAYLWTSRRVFGTPIIPALCLNEIFWFALPILSAHPEVQEYTTGEILKAAGMEIVFLGTMIGVWYWMTHIHPPMRKSILALPRQVLDRARLDGFWMLCYGASVLFVVSVVAGWSERLIVSLPAGSYSVLRTLSATIGILSLFFLAMAAGGKHLRRAYIPIFYMIFVIHMLASASSILLVSVVPLLFAFAAGYTLGGGRGMVVFLAIALLSLNVLHAAKWQMREKYWPQFAGTQVYLTPMDYPAYYYEWFTLGVQKLGEPEDEYAPSGDETILARTSIIQMVLYAERRAPEHIPYLGGETLAVIPKLLIPRFLWPGKPRTHEGQIILNVKFGRQDYDSAQKTYIAWGMLAELYANFGLWGAPLLGIFLGGLFGWVTRLSIDVPTGSFRFILSLVFLVASVAATQTSMAVWITALFQTSVVLLLIALIFMEKRPIEDFFEDEETAILEAGVPT